MYVMYMYKMYTIGTELENSRAEAETSGITGNHPAETADAGRR